MKKTVINPQLSCFRKFWLSLALANNAESCELLVPLMELFGSVERIIKIMPRPTKNQTFSNRSI